MGWAEGGLDPASVFFERSSRLGRGLDAGRPGETGSFLTTILGWLASFRDLSRYQNSQSDALVAVENEDTMSKLDLRVGRRFASGGIVRLGAAVARGRCRGCAWELRPRL